MSPRPCRCWQCLRTRGIRAVAPRLARAFDQHRALAPARHQARERLLKAERLVSHRELQLLRADTTGNPRYAEHRARKLDLARAELARWRERATELSA